MITDTLLCTTVHLPPRCLGGGLRVPIAIFSMVLVDIMISHDLMRRTNKRTHSYTFLSYWSTTKGLYSNVITEEFECLTEDLSINYCESMISVNSHVYVRERDRTMNKLSYNRCECVPDWWVLQVSIYH